MPDIIKLLPDSVANQIAAGEVVQRPASVVKELVENAIDAKSTSITIILKDAGRTLIQVFDNGCGMSETDARMSFERHATSKIRSANDLFALTTMGFRGEALASIAAVAEVTLRTRRADDDLGCEIIINGSDFIGIEPVSCQQGCNFSVKNLFYNIPARRKFLKSDNWELRQCINEFQRVALANPQIELTLKHNSTDIYTLQSGNLRQRVQQLFGKSMNANLIDLKTDTSIVKVTGFIGKPELAKKSYGEQFFFVNNRYMKHPGFHKSVMNAYGNILQPDTIPVYFIYLEVDPERIDVNIHPTKTEIKFEDEQSIFQLLHSTVKEALGKFNIVPSIDFENEMAIQIPLPDKNAEIRMPEINVNPNFNPFADEISQSKKAGNTGIRDYFERQNTSNWQELYKGFENPNHRMPSDLPETGKLFTDETVQAASTSANILMQLKGRYILSPVKSGLMLIDQKRAHERILFEGYLASMQGVAHVAQQNLFPIEIQLPTPDYMVIVSYLNDINKAGFDVRNVGNGVLAVYGCPPETANQNPESVLNALVAELKDAEGNIETNEKERMAQAMAKASAINYGKTLSAIEMRELIDRLFQCTNPNYTSGGKPIISMLSLEELESRF
jgi:DNA mismatch repair protein MutL